MEAERLKAVAEAEALQAERDAEDEAELAIAEKEGPDWSPISIYLFTGFASAADFFFCFCSIGFNCFSIRLVALERFSIDLHWLLEIFVDFQFVCWFLKMF